MEKCVCYVDEKYAVCWGTKECEECSCGGDKTKCSFYPEVREKAKREVAQNNQSKEYLALIKENAELKKELAVTRGFIHDNGLELVLASYTAKYNKGEK